MSKKRKPAHGGNRERAAETAALAGAAISVFNSTTATAGRQSGFVAGLLSYGAGNGLTIRDLERITGWPGRSIRKAIEIERRDGALIISDNRNGYYLTGDPGEAQRFARSMRHRAAQIGQTATAVERAAGLL